MLCAMIAPLLLTEAVVLAGGTVHTMEPGHEPALGTVIVREGRIEAVTGHPAEELPEDARVVDVTGKHLFPGLIDAMVSFDPDHDALYLSSGITTIRDTGNNLALVLTERQAEARDRGPGPRLLTAGAAIDGSPASTPESIAIAEDANAAHLLEPLIEGGVDFFSVQPGLTEKAWRGVLAAAEAHDLDVWGYRLPGMGLEAAVEGGQAGFYFVDALLPQEVDWGFVLPIAMKTGIEALAEHSSAIVPGISAIHVRFDGLDEESAKTMGARYDLSLLSPFYEGWWQQDYGLRLSAFEQDPERGAELQRVGKRVMDKQAEILVDLFEAGVRTIPGSNAPHPWFVPGVGLHRELARWEEAGVERGDILAGATRVAAEALGVAEETGTLAPGRAADLLVLEGDPREDLAVLAKPERVFVRGIEQTAAELRARRARLRQQNEELRIALEQPMEIAEPEVIPGELVLAGQVETTARGIRIGGERYRVVRESPGHLAYSSRLLNPGNASFGAAEVRLVQRTVEGRLASFTFEVERGGRELEVRGQFIGDSLQVERRVDGKFYDTQTTVERIEAIGVGSVTSLLMLPQMGRGGRLPALYFHELFEPEVVPWDLNFSEEGDFVLLTPRSQSVLGIEDSGEFRMWLEEVGGSLLNTHPAEVELDPGSGLPLPEQIADLRRRIIEEAEQRAAEGADVQEGQAPAEDAAPVEAGSSIGVGGGGGR